MTYHPGHPGVGDRAVIEVSCIVAQFRRDVELSHEEASLLMALEEDVRGLPAGTVLSAACG